MTFQTAASQTLASVRLPCLLRWHRDRTVVSSDEPPCDTLSSDTGYTFSDTFLLSPESENPHVGRSSEERHDKVSRNKISSPAVNLGGDVLGVREKRII